MEYNIKNNYYTEYTKKRKPCRETKLIIMILVIMLLVGIIYFQKMNIYASQQKNNQINNSSKVENINNEQEREIIDTEEVFPEEENVAPPVEEEKVVELDYFKDAVFIGDSRTEGFILNNGLSSKTISYTYKGLQVNTIFTDKVINMDGKKITIMDALKETSFSKAYIMLGINETGWVYNDLFIRKYSEIIDEIRKINSNCIIYVQSILPVSKKVSDEHDYIKNSKINEYNSLLEQMSQDKNVYYINVKEAVINEEGVLPEDAATDGIHLNKIYCQKWLEYLKKHAI